MIFFSSFSTGTSTTLFQRACSSYVSSYTIKSAGDEKQEQNDADASH